jgi:hypothetical protein
MNQQASLRAVVDAGEVLDSLGCFVAISEPITGPTRARQTIESDDQAVEVRQGVTLVGHAHNARVRKSGPLAVGNHNVDYLAPRANHVAMGAQLVLGKHGTLPSVGKVFVRPREVELWYVQPTLAANAEFGVPGNRGVTESLGGELIR